MAYSGPIMRTYYSMAQYSQDASIMAQYGYRAVNVEQYNETNGLALTLLLIFGLLLTPFCIGVVILCFLPFAFSKRYNVSYLFQAPYAAPQLPNPYSTVPLQPSYSRPLAPPSYQQYPQSLPPQAYQHMPYLQEQRTMPAYRQTQPTFSVRLREGVKAMTQTWQGWSVQKRVLAIAVGVAVLALALTVIFLAVPLLAHMGG